MRMNFRRSEPTVKNLFKIATAVTLFATLTYSRQATASNICEDAFAKYHFNIKNLDKLSFSQKRPIVYFLKLFAPTLKKAKSNIEFYIIGEDDKFSVVPKWSWFADQTVGDINPDHQGNESGLRSINDAGGLAQGDTVAVRVNFFAKYARGSRQTFYHEMAHIIENRALDDDQKKNLGQLYANAKSKKLFLNDYSSIDASEYFAEAVEAFASEYKNSKYVYPDELDMTRERLEKTDPHLFKFISLLTIY